YTNPRNFRWLLRLSGDAKRKEQGAKRKSKNLFIHCRPPHALRLTPHAYRITRSALASTFGGIVRPICFAAFRLITNSNFVGASIGKSAGLVPFRILSTKVAARRY